MVRSLIKSLVICLTLAVSVILGAPTHGHGDENVDALSSISGIQSVGDKRTAAQKGVTNAMRLANGLAPLAPRKLYDGSKAGSAHRPRTSGTSSAVWTGILVYDSNGLSGNRLGYVSDSTNLSGYHYVTSQCTGAMKDPQLSSGVLTFQGPYPGFFSYSSTLSASSSEYAWMARWPIPIPTDPVPYQAGAFYAESNVWSLGADNELTTTWVNPDGSAIHTDLVYTPDSFSGILMTGSLASYQSTYGNGLQHAEQIRLFLTDQPLCPPVSPV